MEESESRSLAYRETLHAGRREGNVEKYPFPHSCGARMNELTRSTLGLLRYWGIVAPTWGEVGEAVCSVRLGLGFGVGEAGGAWYGLRPSQGARGRVHGLWASFCK